MYILNLETDSHALLKVCSDRDDFEAGVTEHEFDFSDVDKTKVGCINPIYSVIDFTLGRFPNIYTTVLNTPFLQ